MFPPRAGHWAAPITTVSAPALAAGTGAAQGGADPRAAHEAAPPQPRGAFPAAHPGQVLRREGGSAAAARRHACECRKQGPGTQAKGHKILVPRRRPPRPGPRRARRAPISPPPRAARVGSPTPWFGRGSKVGAARAATPPPLGRGEGGLHVGPRGALAFKCCAASRPRPRSRRARQGSGLGGGRGRAGGLCVRSMIGEWCARCCAWPRALAPRGKQTAPRCQKR
ncbi:MAG: hypothetical protein J3K34DRAFT_171000 [Monoraphidium minutum]|nr:MAG: hypothetical protein J3K34DRAFT_171000 [Monoraphidium minutum]